MTKHYSSPIANIGSQSANDTLKNALKESGKSGGDDIVAKIMLVYEKITEKNRIFFTVLAIYNLITN